MQMSDREDSLGSSADEPQECTLGGDELVELKSIADLPNYKADFDVDAPEPRREIYLPRTAHKQSDDQHEELEYNPSTYDYIHRFTVVWPVLSLDPIVDNFGLNRSEFPHQLLLLGGCQVDRNCTEMGEVVLYHFTDVSSTRFEEDKALDPTLIQRKIDVPATVNRIRSGTSFYNNCHPAGSAAIAGLWTDDGVISFINCAPLLKSAGVGAFTSGEYWHTSTGANLAGAGAMQIPPIHTETSMPVGLDKKSQKSKRARGRSTLEAHLANPLCIHATDNNGVEGYALACNPIRSLWLAGDCQGYLRAFHMRPDGSVAVDTNRKRPHKDSIEDIVFTKTGALLESSCFATCSCDGTLVIHDPRTAVSKYTFTVGDADVNVCDWSFFNETLLVTGDDVGQLCLWDIRNTAAPAGVFPYHSQAITSVKFSPNDPSLFAATSDDGVLSIWDHEIENDDVEIADADAFTTEAVSQINQLPKELLFLHMNLQEPKELAFHPQVSGAMFVTDANGIQLFKPINVGIEYDEIEKDSDVEDS